MTFEINRYRPSPRSDESASSQVLSPLEAKFLEREVLGSRKSRGIFAEELKNAHEALSKKEEELKNLEVSELASSLQSNQARIQAQFQFWQAEAENKTNSPKSINTLTPENNSESLATDPNIAVSEDKLSITVKLKDSPELPEIKVTLDPQAREIVAQMAASQQVMALLSAQIGNLERSLAGQGLKLRELRLSGLTAPRKDNDTLEDDYEGERRQKRRQKSS